MPFVHPSFQARQIDWPLLSSSAVVTLALFVVGAVFFKPDRTNVRRHRLARSTRFTSFLFQPFVATEHVTRNHRRAAIETVHDR